MNVNVLILTEGGKNTGFGHITRCTSIYQAFEEIGVQADFVVNGDEGVQGLLPSKNCNVFNWLNDQETLFATIKNADIVLIDSYLAGYEIYEKISNVVKKAVYFDDNMRIEYPKGFVVNGTIFAEQMPYPRREGVTYLLGAKYTPLRKEFWDVPAKLICDSIESVMITFGGTDIRNLSPKVLKLLVDTHPELRKKVIIGKGFRNITEIEDIKTHNTELIYYPDATEMKKIMLESDIAIAGGGQTLYELARVGVAAVVVAVADNQKNNIRGFENAGFSEYAGMWNDEILLEMIERKVHSLRSRVVREHKRRIGTKVVDSDGSSRLVKRVLQNFYKKRFVLRRATFEDAPAIFNLKNSDEVRRTSFSTDKIEWADHLDWLSKKLSDPNCILMVIEHSGQFAGQVRFDITPERKQVVISIGLEKNKRGLGLSPFIINKSIKELLQKRNDVKVIKAYIKDGNIPSIKSFERAGFKFLENKRVKGFKSKVYTKNY